MSKSDRRTFLVQSLSSGAAIALSASVQGRLAAQLPKPTSPPPGGPVLPPPGVKTFSRMPRTATDVASAHLHNREEGAAESLQGGELLELNTFALKLTKRDGAPLKNGK